MALSYELGLEKVVEPALALAVLQRTIGGEMLDDGRLALDDELYVSASLEEHPIVRAEFLQQWGFELGLDVGFSMGHKTDIVARETSEKRLASAALLLPVEFDSNAGLLFQSGVKFMLRRNGQFRLYADWLPWRDPAVLARIDGPYVIDPSVIAD